MKKKVSFCFVVFLFLLQQFFCENFLLQGKFFPDLYSTIDVLYIKENVIQYTFETTNQEKIVNYSKKYDSGLLFFKLSEAFPKEISEDFYYRGIDVITDDKILILAGGLVNQKTGKQDSILLFATTKGFEDPYPFIWPMFHFEVHRQYKDCSSFLKEKNKEYPVENLCYFIVDTPWVEAAKGDGIGEGFTLVNSWNDVYPYLLIMNGYISYEKPYLYKQNNRVKKIKVTGLKSGKTKVLDVLDTPHPQTVDISFITEPEDIRVEIADVYKGTKYDDTCLHFCVTYNNEVIPYENSIGE